MKVTLFSLAAALLAVSAPIGSSKPALRAAKSWYAADLSELSLAIQEAHEQIDEAEEDLEPIRIEAVMPAAEEEEDEPIRLEAIMPPIIAGEEEELEPIRIEPIMPANGVMLKGENDKYGPPYDPRMRDLTDFERTIAESILESAQNVTFNDIIGLKDVKTSLFANAILPSLRPELFDNSLRTPTKGVLLFGPPGNGKTFMAKALANKAKATFMSISSSTIGSKWLGDSENLMRAVFTLARKLQPAIIFVDEIDALLSGRTSGQSDVGRKVVNEFLQGLEGVGSSPTDRILVLAATNRPMDIDSAALRRFKGKYFIGLPEPAGRIQVIKKLLSKHPAPQQVSEEDYAEIAAKTDNYSAADLTNVMKFAAKMPIRDIKDMNVLAKLKPKDLRPLVKSDILKGVENVRASCSMALLEELKEWNRKHGNTKAE